MAKFIKESITKDYGVLPNSDKMVRDEKVGFVTSGYIDKKGTASGQDARFNYLPPGQNIDDQFTADIRSMEMKKVTAMGYPGDGWVGNDSSPGAQEDLGTSDKISLPKAGSGDGY